MNAVGGGRDGTNWIQLAAAYPRIGRRSGRQASPPKVTPAKKRRRTSALAGAPQGHSGGSASGPWHWMHKEGGFCSFAQGGSCRGSLTAAQASLIIQKQIAPVAAIPAFAFHRWWRCVHRSRRRSLPLGKPARPPRPVATATTEAMWVEG